MTDLDICTNFTTMNTDRKTANTVGAKMDRACDSCLHKRARWFCGADDAFLCQGCDSMVHSANQLASRHARVKLETASPEPLSESKRLEYNPAPAWQCGFTRKARTPRQPKPMQKDKQRSRNVSSVVPEMGNEYYMFEETKAQLLYRVPVFDAFAAELCNASNEIENMMADYEATNLFSQKESDEGCDLNNLPAVLPSMDSDMELAEYFGVDVETLLGTPFCEDCGIGPGLIDCKEESELGDSYQENRVKVEEVQAAFIACHFDQELDSSREALDWNFNYESPVIEEDELKEKKMVVAAETAEMMNEESKEIIQNKKLLRLNYERIIVDWDNHGCSWTSGIRPEINPTDCCLDFMVTSSGPETQHAYGGVVGGIVGGSDGGREARVSRYREKRRTRLFSKKIRYQVRKLNAEKRPRMKGRFVKRTGE